VWQSRLRSRLALAQIIIDDRAVGESLDFRTSTLRYGLSIESKGRIQTAPRNSIVSFGTDCRQGAQTICHNRLNSRQSLASTLNFRQCELPNAGIAEWQRREIAQFWCTSGKELLRVAAKKLFKSQRLMLERIRSGLTRTLRLLARLGDVGSEVFVMV
jgi:hypothetical protein